jgi:hypothetical protein
MTPPREARKLRPITLAELAVVAAAIEFEREHNIPLGAKDLALAAHRRQQLYDAVLALRQEKPS